MTILERGLSLTGWRGRGLDLLIGLIGVFGFAPFHIIPLTLLSYTWLMLRLDRVRGHGKAGFGRSLWWGLGYFTANIYWIGSAFIARGPEFIPIMPPMVLGLALLLALFWACAGAAYTAFFKGDQWHRFIGLALLLWLAEFGRGHLFGGFPWNLPGYVFSPGRAVSQMAGVIGIYGISFLTLLMAAGLALAGQAPRRAVRPLLCVAGLWIIPLIYGSLVLSKVEPEFVENVSIRLVQSPFDQADKFDPEKSVEIVKNHMRLSLSPGMENVTHIVWPEGAVVGDGLSDRGLMHAMGEYMTRVDDTPPLWLFNTLRTQISDSDSRTYNGRAYYNSSTVIGFDKDGAATLVTYNDKHRLVPFGEFIPGGDWVEDLGARVVSASLGSITAAPDKTLADFPGLPPVSPQICYETVFSRLTPRPDGKQKAEWILNQTNDAWFGDLVGPYQHAEITAYRAIEEGLPIIRSASNGVSGLIDGYGRYVVRLEPDQSDVADVRLPRPRSGPRLVPNHNLLLFILLAFASVGSLLLNRRDTRHAD